MEPNKKVLDIGQIFDILKTYPQNEIEDILVGVMNLIGIINPLQRQDQSQSDKTALSFYREKKPKGKIQELLVLCYFLEKYKNLEWFTSKDIEQVIGEARLPKIKDLDKTFYELKRKKDWIRTDGKKHQLTHKGIDFVEIDLPNNKEPSKTVVKKKRKKKINKQVS